jgi:hypothetical protein
MRAYKNYVLTAAGALAVIGALALFSPRRSEAQFASPVRVANSAAGPALTSSIDDPGRIPYQSSQTAICTTNVCFFAFPAVPANHRLVVQHVGGYYPAVSPNAPARLLLTSSAGSFGTVRITPSNSFANLFDLPVLAYFDAGQQPQTYATVESGIYNGNATSMLIGYMLDCSAAPCAAIAQ